jgi:hypothetical protein
MTKAVLAALALAVALVPAASAHGAPPVREVDARVLLDDDGMVGYGGCVDGTCQPAIPPGGLDVLALDVREAFLADGSPAVVFRVIVQSEEPAAGASLVLHVDAPAGGKDLRLDTADGLSYTAAGFDRLDGPIDVGDGHPKALDGWVRESTLGAKPGDSLSGMTVASSRGDAEDDVMPGGWFVDGAEVPAVPDEPDPGAVTETPEPGTYVMKGPAALVALSADSASMAAPGKVKLTLANPIALEQFANLTLERPDGLPATLASAGILLQPSGTRTVDLAVGNATKDGVVRVVATTDLGGRAVVEVPVKAASAPSGAASNGTAGAHSSSSTVPAGKSSPGPDALLVPALASAALALRKRR